MHETPAQRALTASTIALVVAMACVMAFLPPLAQRTMESVLRIVLIGLVLGGALLLHWVFLGIAAGRLGRSVAGWVAFAALLFPIGGAAALILFNWFGDEANAPTPAPHG